MNAIGSDIGMVIPLLFPILPMTPSTPTAPFRQTREASASNSVSYETWWLGIAAQRWEIQREWVDVFPIEHGGFLSNVMFVFRDVGL